MIISLPRRLVIDNLLPFLQQINDHKYEEDIVIDFSPVNYSFPLAMLVIGRELRRFVKQRYQYGLQTKATGISNDNNSHSYLMHLGFFDYINIKAGKKLDKLLAHRDICQLKK